MNRRLTLSIGLGALFVVRAAQGQELTIGYQGLPYKASGETQTGIQISDGVLMHVGAGAEGGYDSNVFYQDTNPIGSGIIRVGGYAEITNATRTGVTPSGLSFGARAGLQYRRYTSTAPEITGNGYQNAFVPSAGLSVSTSATPTLSFGFADAFLRQEDPPYNPGQSAIIRDNNQASAEMRWAPGGGRINSVLRYSNIVDIFETDAYSYANSLTQELMLDASWKWLPKTAVFFQARQGYITYLNDPDPLRPAVPAKYSSFPLRLVAGLRGLITEKISAVLSAGYVNAFYSCSAGSGAGCISTGGIWGSTYLSAEATYRPSLLSRIILGYRHDFQNSVISTFYYDDQVYASYVQQIAGRASIDLSGRYHHRNYQGFIPQGGVAQDRVDDFFQVGATADYFIRNWAFAGIGYSLVANSSNAQITNVGSVDYVKHQVFARLGLTY